MAFLQTFKKRDRSKLIHARYFPFDNQTRSILYTFACTFFLFCLEEEREKEREIIPTNKRERKENKRVSKQSDVTRSSNVTSASRDHLPLRCSSLTRTRFDKTVALSVGAKFSVRRKRTLGVLYIDGAQEHNRIMLSRRVHNDNVYHAAIQAQLACEKYRSIKRID